MDERTQQTQRRLLAAARGSATTAITSMAALIAADDARETAAADLNKADKALAAAERHTDEEMASLIELCALAGVRHVGKSAHSLYSELQVSRYGGAYKDQAEEQRRHNQAVDRVVHALTRVPPAEVGS